MARTGRPTEMKDGKRRNVYIDDRSWEVAMKVGEGNASDGIRQALNSEITLDETTIDMIVEHVKKENGARVGYPYPERTENGKMILKLAESFTLGDLKQIRAAIIKTGWCPSPVEVAGFLVGVSPFYSSTTDEIVLSKCPDFVRHWGVPISGVFEVLDNSDQEIHECQVCGSPATSRANFGWACISHYDELS